MVDNEREDCYFECVTQTSTDLLTLPEVADLLRVSQSTVYALLRRGEIPAHKVGAQWRVWRDDALKVLGR